MVGITVDIISRKIIKPSSPTPPHLTTFKLSLLDQLYPPFYGSTVFFYTANTDQDGDKIMERSHRLQESLSETLTRFYPMAGRLKDAATIECNDEGAYFVEARVGCQLADFLRQPDVELVDQFRPLDPKTTEMATGCIVLIQLNIFDCGGMAITTCLSHKTTDASSLITFLQSWTATARESGEAVLPEFVGGSLLPSRDLSFFPTVNIPTGSYTTKRFVFDASSIAGLKDKVGGALIEQRHPSRVEVVLALILKCAMAASRLKFGSSRQSLLFQAVNLRNRMVPPLPENSIGNLIWVISVLVKESEVELHELASKMRKEVTEFCKENANKFKGDEGFVLVCESLKEKRELLETKEMDSYRCSSWSRLPLYEVDFGWGKPIWVSSASVQFGNTIVLVDTKRGDGIEAWVTLDEQEMAIFERNEELLAFASFNPSALIYI